MLIGAESWLYGTSNQRSGMKVNNLRLDDVKLQKHIAHKLFLSTCHNSELTSLLSIFNNLKFSGQIKTYNIHVADSLRSTIHLCVWLYSFSYLEWKEANLAWYFLKSTVRRAILVVATSLSVLLVSYNVASVCNSPPPPPASPPPNQRLSIIRRLFPISNKNSGR